MRESLFIERNKNKWDQLLDQSNTTTDETVAQFVDITNDLSYSKTHFPHSKLVPLLNQLAIKKYNQALGRQEGNSILNFFKFDYPLVIGHHIKLLYAALAIFLAFVVLGIVLSFYDKTFIEGILGSSYVQMTQENIKKGQPFAVYEDNDQIFMFLRIMLNNLRVGLFCYMSGFFTGIGTVIISFQNGIMVGAFYSMFQKAGLGFQFFMVIMLHGTLELFGIVLELMAGLLLGYSWFFPGTLSRWNGFKQGLRRSMIIYLGSVPFTVLAAIIESFVTFMGKKGISFTTNPVVSFFLISVLIGSFAFIIWYYFIYAKKIAKTIPFAEYLRLY